MFTRLRFMLYLIRVAKVLFDRYAITDEGDLRNMMHNYRWSVHNSFCARKSVEEAARLVMIASADDWHDSNDWHGVTS